MVDNTIALQVRPLDIATPLMQAAKMRQMESEQQQQQESHNREAVASEMRGLAPYADSPEFAGRWMQSIDTLAQAGKIRPDIAARMRDNPSQLQLRSVLAQSEDPRLALQRAQLAETTRQHDIGQANTDRAFKEGVRQFDVGRSEDNPQLRFQREQALREQGNTDRTFAEGVRQFDVGQGTKNLPPGWVRSPDGGMDFVPRGPADPKYIERTTGAKDKTDEQIAARQKAVLDRKLDPNDPQIRTFVLTGRFPKEDQQPLTAHDKKVVDEADEMVMTNTGVIDLLRQAKTLSPKAMTGPFASKRGYLTSLTGEGAGQTTVDLDNLVVGNALSQLKTVFGASPTEGERKILLDLQGSTSLTDANRQMIYDRALVLAERKLVFYKKRADELRGGTYYKSPEAKAAMPAANARVGAPAAPKDESRVTPGNPSAPGVVQWDEYFK